MLETFLSLSPVLIIALCVVIPVVVALPIVRAILKKSIKCSGEDATVLGAWAAEALRPKSARNRHRAALLSSPIATAIG